MISATVGKSGPFTCSQSSRNVTSGSSIRRMHAAATSRRLCGGMSVAMPTAMPVAPFSNTCGSRAGSHDGSCSVPSKFGDHSTVPLPSSESSTSASFVSFASV